MANAVYPKYKEAILSGSSNSALTGSGSTGLWVALVDLADYTYSSAHEFYSSISAAVVAEAEIANVTLVNGLIDGDNVTLSSVSGDQSEALILYRKNAGADTTWRLVAFLDSSVTGLPITPNGGNINTTWSGSGIVQL